MAICSNAGTARLLSESHNTISNSRHTLKHSPYLMLEFGDWGESTGVIALEHLHMAPRRPLCTAWHPFPTPQKMYLFQMYNQALCLVKKNTVQPCKSENGELILHLIFISKVSTSVCSPRRAKIDLIIVCEDYLHSSCLRVPTDFPRCFMQHFSAKDISS